MGVRAQVNEDGTQVIITWTHEGTSAATTLAIGSDSTITDEQIARAYGYGSGQGIELEAYGRNVDSMTDAIAVLRRTVNAALRRHSTGETTVRTPREPRPTAAPTIDEDWITGRLDVAAGSRTVRGLNSTTAIDGLHTNRLYIERYLGQGQNRTSMTIRMFNMLYQIPGFAAYLSAQATGDQNITALERSIRRNDEGRYELPADTSLHAVATNLIYGYLRAEAGRTPAYNTELTRLPDLNSVGSSGNSDLITATALYLRRNNDNRAAQWNAPEVRPIDGAQQPAQIPRIGIIGDSISAWGDDNNTRYGEYLQAQLRAGNPGAVVETHAVRSQSINQIRGRFRTDILAVRPQYNTVIIQGGVNNITGINVLDAQRTFTEMIRTARENGMRVILVTLPPWAGFASSNAEAQRRTAELNRWIRLQAQTDGSVVVVDLASMGNGDPPRWRSEFSDDNLHPNDRGRREIARLIVEHAHLGTAAATQTQEVQRTPLEQFAIGHWQNFDEQLFTMARDRNMRGIVGAIRQRPPGHDSVEAAIAALPATDEYNDERRAITVAFDRSFNGLMQGDSPLARLFRDFVERTPRYNLLTRLARLPAGGAETAADETRRQLAAHAVQEFAMNLTQRRSADWNRQTSENFRQDVDLLYGQVVGSTATPRQLAVDGNIDLGLISLIALMNWRIQNPNARPGQWATGIEGINIPQTEERRRIRQGSGW